MLGAVRGGLQRPKIRERLRYDPQLNLELSLCHEWGIPHSQFLSWSPRDRAKAIAFTLEKSARCAMCGTAEWEWDANRDAYQAVTERCEGCYRKDAVMSVDEGAPPLPAGTRAVLIPTTSKQWRDLLDRQVEEYRAEVERRRAEQEGT